MRGLLHTPSRAEVEPQIHFNLTQLQDLTISLFYFLLIFISWKEYSRLLQFFPAESEYSSAAEATINITTNTVACSSSDYSLVFVDIFHFYFHSTLYTYFHLPSVTFYHLYTSPHQSEWFSTQSPWSFQTPTKRSLQLAMSLFPIIHPVPQLWPQSW